ncbi:9988_t:CDS:1, partial [Gigaspora margarita]
PEKVLAMSKIRSDILYSRKVKNAKEYDNHIRRLHIAAPISSDDELSEELTITDLDYQVSGDENEDNVEEAVTKSNNVEKATTGSSNVEEATTGSSNIVEVASESSNWTNQNFEDEDLITEEEQEWENTINEWIELGERENQFEDQSDEILLTSDWDADFGFGGREKHPADDETAKWSLDSLFISSLEAPSYFDSELTSLLK